MKRIVYFDFLKGIAAFSVIGIHTFSSFYKAPFNEAPYYAVWLYNLLCCAVPIFCAVSAYFCINKDLSSSKYIQFLKKKASRVYIPMIVGSLPWFLHDLLHIVDYNSIIGGGD